MMLLSKLPSLRKVCINHQSAIIIPNIPTSTSYLNEAQNLQEIQWTWLERPSAAETVLRGIKHRREGSSIGHIALEPVMRRVCDSIFLVSHAVTVPV
jgi:hypothetical protein